ncbi:hypothetical protein [Dactylosporangium cerinum]
MVFEEVSEAVPAPVTDHGNGEAGQQRLIRRVLHRHLLSGTGSYAYPRGRSLFGNIGSGIDHRPASPVQVSVAGRSPDRSIVIL